MFQSRPRKPPKKPLTPDDLYPELPPEQRQQAYDNLRAYFEVVYRIYTEHQAKDGMDEELEQSRLRNAWQKRFANKNKSKDVSQNKTRAN